MSGGKGIVTPDKSTTKGAFGLSANTGMTVSITRATTPSTQPETLFMSQRLGVFETTDEPGGDETLWDHMTAEQRQAWINRNILRSDLGRAERAAQALWLSDSLPAAEPAENERMEQVVLAFAEVLKCSQRLGVRSLLMLKTGWGAVFAANVELLERNGYVDQRTRRA